MGTGKIAQHLFIFAVYKEDTISFLQPISDDSQPLIPRAMWHLHTQTHTDMQREIHMKKTRFEYWFSAFLLLYTTSVFDNTYNVNATYEISNEVQSFITFKNKTLEGF